MAWGCFVDITQQDGSKVRMFYPMTKQNLAVVEWIGINEQMADKFKEQQSERIFR